MLKQERQHFEKINKIAFGHTDRFDGILTNPQKDTESHQTSRVLQQLDINSVQRVSDSFCNDSFT